uniref:Ig-like domain-containing protein n=1 Tax=Pseudonaja textilis TaxID=8673 RepID=A0A670ZYA2_PSETE
MAGTYICEASVPSISGLKRNESVQVIVEGKPEVDIQQTILQDQTVKFTCTVLGHPPPEIRWNIPGGEAPVKHSANKYISELLVELTPKLIQSGVQCTAENKYGSTRKNFELKMGKKLNFFQSTVCLFVVVGMSVSGQSVLIQMSPRLTILHLATVPSYSGPEKRDLTAVFQTVVASSRSRHQNLDAWEPTRIYDGRSVPGVRGSLFTTFQRGKSTGEAARFP